MLTMSGSVFPAGSVGEGVARVDICKCRADLVSLRLSVLQAISGKIKHIKSLKGIFVSSCFV